MDDARLTDTPIDARAWIAKVVRPDAGAVLTFAGVVRNEHLGRRVLAIDYHAYRAMAEQEIRRIEAEVAQRWPVGVRIVHRLGHLDVGSTSVLIAVSSAHRDEGFLALRYAIDTLKERVPIWKKEIYEDGEAWLEGS
jgi:molybdopterin synthase catalytic subunit